MDHMPELHLLEREARRLRADYSHDLLVSAAIAFDLAIRRAASRLKSYLSANYWRLSRPD
jgi:PIN domain nuclease of toxin-antitoxin system